MSRAAHRDLLTARGPSQPDLFRAACARYPASSRRRDIFNNSAVLRRLDAIKDAVCDGKRSQVVVARQELALLIDRHADDRLKRALDKVCELSGKWIRGAVDIEPAEVTEAVENAIALLGHTHKP